MSVRPFHRKKAAASAIALILLVAAPWWVQQHRPERADAGNRKPAQAESAPAAVKAGPAFTTMATVLESQPIQNGQVVYWDQSVADALGIRVPPGRVGLESFNQAVLAKVGYEIREGTAKLENPASNHAESGAPHIFVETDGFGGSGRAGYIEVEPGVWVNIKGIGLTGTGRVKHKPAGPPSTVFSSHSDGSATLEEAIKEATMARMADAELKRGSGRILAIIYTGRTLRYEDGRVVPLATIVRAPTRRFDQEPRAYDAVRAVGEANSRRIFKGDFVNSSNIGAYGEMVDFGCMTHTCGYAPIESSQMSYFLKEDKFAGESGAIVRPAMNRAVGENLVNQIGIPEEHVQGILLKDKDARDRFRRLGAEFRDLIYFAPGGGKPNTILVDFKPVDPEALRGTIHWNEYFREAAADWLDELASNPRRAPEIAARIRSRETAKLLAASPFPEDPKFRELVDKFIGELSSLVIDVPKYNRVGDLKSYASGVREVARFKNRDVPALLRPNVFTGAGQVSDRFVQDHDPAAVTEFIENTVQGNRYSTTPVADSRIIAQAEKDRMNLYFRAFTEHDGTEKLFTHPDLTGAGAGETFSFRVSTDGWASYRDWPARKVRSSYGEYFKVEIPYGAAPFTWRDVEAVPFVREQGGSIRWLGNGLNIRGPPLVFNERFGLPRNFRRQRTNLYRQYRTRTSIFPDELSGPPSNQWTPADLEVILRDLQSPDTVTQDGTWLELKERWDQFIAQYADNNRFREVVREVVASDEISPNVIGSLYLKSRESTLSAVRPLQAELRAALLKKVDREWLGPSEFVGVFFGRLYPGMSREERKPFFQLLLRRIREKPEAGAQLSALTKDAFLKLPEADVAISALIKRKPDLTLLASGILSSPELVSDRGMRLLEKLISRPGYTPDVGRYILAGPMSSSEEKSAKLAQLILDSSNANAHASLANWWLGKRKFDETSRSITEQLVEKGTADSSILSSVARRPEFAESAQALGWMKRILDRGNVKPVQVLEVIGGAAWDAHADFRRELIDKLVAGGNSFQKLAMTFHSSTNLAADPHMNGWLLDLFKSRIVDEDLVQIVAKKEYRSLPVSYRMVKTWISASSFSRMKPRVQAKLVSSLMEWNDHPRGMDILLELAGRLEPGSEAATKFVWLLQTAWVNHPRLGELVKILENRGLMNPWAMTMVANRWAEHPLQAEIVEWGIRSGAIPPDWSVPISGNPVLKAICAGQGSEQVAYGCLKEAFDRGVTSVDALRSPNENIRKAAAELIERYHERLKYAEPTAPYNQQYREYYRNRCLVEKLAAAAPGI